MAAQTLAEFRTELRSNLGDRTELASSDTDVDRWLNRAQMRIARRRRFDEIATTESFTATYTGTASIDKVVAFSSLTNTNPRAIISIRVLDGTSSDKLTYVPVRRWDRFVPSPDSLATARPSHYTVYSRQIEWWRVPNKAYTFELRMGIWPVDLTTTSQVSDLLEKDDAIVAAATYYGFRSNGFTKDAASWLADFASLMDEAKDEEFDRPDHDGKPAEPLGPPADYWADPFVGSAPR